MYVNSKVTTMRLKRWESPRRQGRNDKGRGGSARARQLRKQRQQLRRKLKQAAQPDGKDSGSGSTASFFWPSGLLRSLVAPRTPASDQGQLN